jgi:ATP-dependent Zn protease
MLRGSRSPWVVPVAVLLLLFIGLPALLYAYRAQSPAMPTISLGQGLAEIRDGKADRIDVENERATLTLKDGSRQQMATGGDRDAILAAVTDYNRTHPADNIQLRYNDASPWGTTLLSIVLSLLPLALLFLLVVLAARAIARSRSADPYEQLARIADLRDRGVLTEEEFQREKRKLLG